MKFSFYIAKRYLFSKSSNNTINIITLIATLGVIVGTLALFIVLSGFSGLRTFSINFLNTSDPDIKITSVLGKSFEFSPEIKEILTRDSAISAFSKVIEERAFFEYHNKTHIASIKGVDSNYTKVNRMDTTVYTGTWLNKNTAIGTVVGNGISNSLSLGIDDYLNPLKIYVPKPGEGYLTNPNDAFSQINTLPVGIFAVTDEIDKKFVFIDLQLAQQLLNYKPAQISAIEIKTEKNADAKETINYLKSNLGTQFKVQTREQLNAVFYKMLNTENLASYLIFTLILIIALFNVIGAIIMMILDKKHNLKTFYSLGATIKEIKLIFIFQGFLLTLFGMVIGLILGISLVLLQLKFHFFKITAHLAYPVELTFLNIIGVALTILLLGYLAVKIASSRITKKLIE